MKWLIYCALISTALVCASCGSSGNGSDGGTSNPPPAQAPGISGAVQVTIPSGAISLGTAAYGANPLVINAGTTVTWTNQDSMPHTATSDDRKTFNSGTLAQGHSFSFQFTTTGTFPYHCEIHGAASMSGVVQVNP